MQNYIIELKNRFVLLLISWSSVMFVSYVYKENLLFLLVQSEFCECNKFSIDYFIFTDVSEVFSVYLELCLFLSLQIIYLYIIYQAFIFLGSGLFKAEYYYFNTLLTSFIGFWLFSLFLLKYALIPVTYQFFFNFKNLGVINLHFEAKLSQYLKFYIKCYSMFTFYIQIFALLILLFNYIHLDMRLLKNYRKIFHFLFIIFATLFSPPDVLTQLAVSLLLVIFYESLILWLYVKTSLQIGGEV